MILCPETSEDFRKYYSGTYIVVPEAVPNEVAYVSQVGPTECILKYANDQKAQIIYSDVGYEVKSPLTLQKQYFLIDNEPAFIERIPARKWKKGIANTNTRISTPNDIPIDLNFVSLNAYLQNKGKVSQPEEIVKNNQGVISPHWAIHQGLIYLKGYAVGKFNQRRQIVILGRQFVPMFPKSFAYEWRILSA